MFALHIFHIIIYFRVKKNWIDVVTVPLLMAYTTRYQIDR